ncbi:MAG TPA: hypothetical protein VN947_34350 [Polyangia bacterium]|nr:hypothetical protein [Polyangia bacterium]
MRARLTKVLDTLFGDGGSRPELRRAAAAQAAAIGGGALPARETLPAALASWVDKVARHAWKITDDDVAALRAAGFDEEAIFEVTIAAATGAGLARYQVAARAIAAAASKPAKSGAGG